MGAIFSINYIYNTFLKNCLKYLWYKNKEELKQFNKELKVHYIYYRKIIFFQIVIVYNISVAYKLSTEYLYVLDRFDVGKLTFDTTEIQLRDMQLAVTRWRVYKISCDRSILVATYFYIRRIYIFNVHAIFMFAWYFLHLWDFIVFLAGRKLKLYENRFAL